jgi:lysophospholipase L1-like esterase
MPFWVTFVSFTTAMSIPCHIFLSLFCFLVMPAAYGQLPDKNQRIKYLALGDSYTIGESVEENSRWPVQLVSVLRRHGYTCDEPTIIATTGWRTDDLARAIENARPPKNFNLVSLLIGVNNQYQKRPAADYEPEFEQLLKTAIVQAGGDTQKVFVVSIPDYGYTPFGRADKDRISKEIDEFNAANRKIADKYKVRYFNITEISRKGLDDPELVARDGLHPSGKMYKQWVELIEREWKIF